MNVSLEHTNVMNMLRVKTFLETILASVIQVRSSSSPSSSCTVSFCFTGDFTGIQVKQETVTTARTLTNVKMELTTVTHTLIVRITLDPLIVHATLVGREMVSDAQVNKLQTH